MYQLLWPHSLRSRFLLILVVGVLLAQSASYWLWQRQAASERLALVDKVSRNVAFSVASTVRFFRKLPLEYRHIVLDQLRNMGGTRFFVSLNQERILITDVAESEEKILVRNNFTEVLEAELRDKTLLVEFSSPETLKVLNNQIMLSDLPPRWADYSLLLEPLSPPITVVQIELAPREWLYVATLLPIPDFLGNHGLFGPHQLLYLGIMLLIVVSMAFGMIRWLTQPLTVIQTAAEAFGRDIDHAPLPERGSQEMVATARAFNHMQERIKHYISERQRLFSAISHDLKTPITRLRLRAELLDDTKVQAKFVSDLQELEQMVQNALQVAKETDSHEEPAWVNLHELLTNLGEGIPQTQGKLHIHGEAAPLRAQPLALKRALGNLLDNACFYGQCARVHLHDGPQQLEIRIHDQGPGIPESEHQRVFEPYVRLEKSRNRNTGGSGLGLGIARSMIHTLGGNLQLSNHPQGGLEVVVQLPREPLKKA